MKLRKLGKGHWDKKLIERMLYLSESNDIDEALKEWKATGNCWWPSSYDSDIPAWVANHINGPGYCLCGHTIYYHFEIENTENGTIECVGSDHINAYMIARSISEDLGVDIETIDDVQIAAWTKERLKNMKADAWWSENGDHWSTITEGLREIDAWANSEPTDERYYDAEIGMHVRRTKLRKRAKGSPLSPHFQMASIFWRWDNPDNSRNQSQSRGYPNDDLVRDATLLHLTMRQPYAEHMERRQVKIVARQRFLQEQRIREEEAAEERIRQQELFRQKQAEREAERKREIARKAQVAAVEIDEVLSKNPIAKKWAEYYGVVFDSLVCRTDAHVLNLRESISRFIREDTALMDCNMRSLRTIYGSKERLSFEEIEKIRKHAPEVRGPLSEAEVLKLQKQMRKAEGGEANGR